MNIIFYKKLDMFIEHINKLPSMLKNETYANTERSKIY